MDESAVQQQVYAGETSPEHNTCNAILYCNYMSNYEKSFCILMYSCLFRVIDFLEG